MVRERDGEIEEIVHQIAHLPYTSLSQIVPQAPHMVLQTLAGVLCAFQFVAQDQIKAKKCQGGALTWGSVENANRDESLECTYEFIGHQGQEYRDKKKQ